MHFHDESTSRYGRYILGFLWSLISCTLCENAALAADLLTPVAPADVKVSGEIGRRVDVTVNNNLLQLDAEGEFLKPFQQKARTSGYIGLGKLIDAAVRFAAYSGQDPLIGFKDQLVASTIAAQQADGYIGIMAESSRMQGMWDVHEMAYLIYALASDYQYFDQQPSLEAARLAADYILAHWSEIPSDWAQQTGVATHVSVTGLERSLLKLSELSGDPRYGQFVINQRALPSWNLDLVIGRRPQIEGHIYAYLCRCLAQLEMYRSDPQSQLLRPTNRAVHFMTHADGMAITGGCGQWEIWTDDQDGREALGETCATAYQLRLFDSLLRLQGNSRYGDLMERTIYNALFAAQSPDGRKIRYYSPMEGERRYHPGDTYCCPCNYRRIIAKLPTMIYYRSQSGIVINQYTASRATIPLAEDVRVTVSQDTDYPSSGKITIGLSPTESTHFPLQLRIPTWCEKAQVTVNDQLAGQPAGGVFFTLHREWQAGDQIVLNLPMPWRLVRGRKRQAGRVAVVRGPLVYCLAPRQNTELRSLDGADLGRITLDPESMNGPLPDDSVRPNGTAFEVRGWQSGYAVSRPAPLQLRLTEFPDPQGTSTYFRLQDLSVAVDDELLDR